MKRCPSCAIDLPDGFNCCKLCGGALVAAVVAAPGGLRCPACRAEVRAAWICCQYCGADLPAALAAGAGVSDGPISTQVGPVEPVETFTPEEPVAAGPACPHCGRPSRAGAKYCTGCGEDLPARKGGVVEEPPDAGKERKRRMLLGATIALAVLLAGGGLIYWLMRGSVESKLKAAIAAGQLVKPPEASAYTFYQQMKRDGASAERLAPYHAQLLPLLTPRPEQMLADLAAPGGKDAALDEWEEARQMLAWASEMKPEDGALAARASYAAGRVAYLKGQKDEAAKLWDEAAARDGRWALPKNSLGVVYNERQDYATARRHLFEAARREPRWAVPYNNIGTSFYYQRDYDTAERYYLQAVERAPQWARPHAWLGDIATYRRDYTRAVEEYEAVLKLAEAGTSLKLEEIREKLERARKKVKESQEAAENPSGEAQ
jgi:tetratricopeptide (TPR) repeat protein